MFFDLSVQVQRLASEDTGGIGRREDVLNSEEKQARNTKGKGRKGKTPHMHLLGT
jgi:hypothetical protein